MQPRGCPYAGSDRVHEALNRTSCLRSIPTPRSIIGANEKLKTYQSCVDLRRYAQAGGDPKQLKVLANAERGFAENASEGLAFEYDPGRPGLLAA